MNIDELADEFEIDLGLDEACAHWLFLPPQSAGNLEWIAYLTHTDTATLLALEVDSSWRQAEQKYWFCRTCLFVNPVDVFAPRWIREWLGPEYTVCPTHGVLEVLRARDLSGHRNLASLLASLSAFASIRRSGLARKWRPTPDGH